MNKKIILSILASSILVAQNIELEEITVVSATKTKQSIKDVTSNISVITKEEIEEKNFTTVVDAINSVSGINFTRNGGLGSSTSLFVRGMSSKRVLVLIDGVRYNDPTGISGAPFSHLMMEDIQQIEIVKGAQSGVWGADASAGVINIITTTPEDGLHASILGEYGSFNTSKAGGLVSYKTKDYYVKISSQIINSDGFSAQSPYNSNIDDYEDDAYENITTNIKFGFNIDDSNKIDLSHTMIDATSDYDGWNDPNGEKLSKTKDSFSQINYNNENSFAVTDVFAKISIFDRNYPQGYTKEYDGEVQEYGVKSSIAYNENDFILIGADYKVFEHQNDLNGEYTNKAIFLSNSNVFDFYGKTIISESIRFDDYDKFDDKTTAKVGIKHFFNNLEDLIMSANLGSAYNVPTLYNLYSPTYGSTDLTPETTISYDLTLAYKDLQVTYFHSDTEDMIDFNFSTWKYNNLVGNTIIKGIEVEYKTNVTEDILITSSYTYLDAKNNDGKALGRRPKDTIKLSVDYYGIEKLHIGVFGEYIGERYDSDDKEDRQTGKYTVVNLVSNYDINKNFSVYAKIDNLFDKYYQVVDGYATAPLSAYAGIKAKF